MKPITFISLGPGDPDLVTIKGLKALQKADIIFAPSTQRGEGNFLSRSKEILIALGVHEDKISLFSVPMSKDRTEAISNYQAVAQQAMHCQQKGMHVAITAEGDGGFYSSAQYINDTLTANDIPTEKIEGIPAFIACGALANLHIVKQEEQLLVIPGMTTTKDLLENINTGKTIVIMKPSQCEEAVKELAKTMNTIQFHYFENVGIKDKEFYTSEIEEIVKRSFPYFSLLIIKNH